MRNRSIDFPINKKQYFYFQYQEDIEDEQEEPEEPVESGIVAEIGPRADAPEPTETYDDVSEFVFFE